MQGGTIENCTANTAGGGVYTDGEFTMESGTIENCTAISLGGGVYVDDNSFNMKGGTIKGCTATTGGGVYINNLTMDAQGGSVYGGVYNNATLKNTSAEGSTIFYGSSKFGYEDDGATPSIYGYRVEFMKDGARYAQTLVGVDGSNNHLSTAKISQPEDPTREGQHFAGWSYKKADNSGTETWDFGKTFEENNPECEDDELSTNSNPRTEMKVTLTAEWHTLTEVSAKAATCTETGNVQYWKCTVDGCGELFEDNKGKNATTINAVTTAIDSNNHAGALGSYQYNKDGHWQVYSCCETATAKVAHDFSSGNTCVCGYEKPRRVYRGSGAPTISAVLSHPDAASATNYTSGICGLTFRSTASFASFRGVQVDGKTIASTNYIAEEGSIVVYLKAVYLQTLPKGAHTVTILSTEGNATMNFTIGGVQSAKTADAGVAIYALMALTSYTGTALVVRGRKRK